MKQNDEIRIKTYEVGAHEEIDLFVVKLTEEDGNRYLSIKIDETVSQIFGLRIPHRPPLSVTLYHIMNALLVAQHVTVTKVLIHDRVGGAFISKIFLRENDGTPHTIEFIATHAIALGFIANAPIFVTNNVFQLAWESDEYPPINWYEFDEKYALNLLKTISDEQMKTASAKELESYLELAIRDESYELAERIKNAIQHVRRTKN
jgi:bifunctional DNase/RNase